MIQSLCLFDDEKHPATCLNRLADEVQVSIVVPTYREEANLAELSNRLFAAVSEAQIRAELIIVDDNSGDGTIELCEELAKTYPIRLITRTDERGLATAVICGLQHAQGEFAVVMDADLSHPPLSVPCLLRPLQTDTADFVIGSRYVQGGTMDESWSLFRHANSRIAGWLARGLTPVRDPMAGFFAIRKVMLGDLSELNPCGYKIGLEVLVRCRCERVTEIPIHFEDRKHGESKLNLRAQWLYIQHLFRLYAFCFPELFRFATFAAVGTSGMLLDLAVFRSLLAALGLPAGRAIGIWTAMTWNYELNRRFTFHELAGPREFGTYLQFCTACLLGAAISWVTSIGLVVWSETFSMRPVAAAMIGTAVAALANFSLCRLWVFRERRESSESEIPDGLSKRTLDRPVSRSKSAA